jgi:hypothetical protein
MLLTARESEPLIASRFFVCRTMDYGCYVSADVGRKERWCGGSNFENNPRTRREQ